MRDQLIEILEGAGKMIQFPGTLANILIENGVTIQKWIPLSEEKPNRDDLVIVFFEGMRDTPAAIQIMYGWCIGGSASHWMPLPEPPK